MSSCCGLRKTRSSDHEPLLPVYQDDTVLQRRLHQKLHTYQMLRALSKGYMPTNDQVIINLRTLLASDILNPDEYSVTDSGRLLARQAKTFLKQLIDTFQHKNSENQIQDFIWLLVHSRVSLDVGDISAKLQKAKGKAQIAGAFESVRTVFGYLLTSSDFRILLADLQTIGRQIFKDFAGSVEKVADSASKQIDPVGSDVQKRANDDQMNPTAIQKSDEAPAPTQEQLVENVTEVTSTIGQGVGTVLKDTRQSAEDHLSSEEKDVLLSRLKAGIGRVRNKKDYSDSVSTMTLLIKRYALAYSRAIEETVETAEEDLHTNDEMEAAAKNFWSLVKSFGDAKEWEALEAGFKKFQAHQKHNPDFESVMIQVGNTIQQLLTDPDSWDHLDEKFSRINTNGFNSDGSLADDARDLVRQLQRTQATVMKDQDVLKLWNTSLKMLHIISPAHSTFNKDLYQDAINAFIPLLIQGIQHIPIPRLEISVPEIDLLLENLILEPGKTVNQSSFLPFRLRIETQNDLEIRKARTRVHSELTSLVTVKIDGMTIRAEEVGFWLRAHSGLLRLADEGIMSFELDERGMDIHFDVEVGADRLEHILTLKAVRVHIHKLSYTLRKSKFTWLAWLVKPFLRPILRKVIEKQLSNAIADFFHAANREIVFARERLRATKIADPQDLATFFRAIMARLTPPEDPDVEVRLGVAQPGKGIFKGVYAPGSVVKVWNEEATKASEVIEDFDRHGWKNDIFEVVA